MQVRFPPLHTLRTFEAAAMRLNFTQAAEDVHITPSAVSQQIRQLEEFLGVKLFRRLTRQLVLTDEGQALYVGVHNAMQNLRDSLEQLQLGDLSSRLVVSVLPSFGSKWLVPRLHRFLRLRPKVRVTVLPSTELVNFDRDDIDVGLRWGDGVWPGLVCQPIIEETLFAVCSPEFIDREGPIKSPQDVAERPLLGDVTHDMWAAWFTRFGLDGTKFHAAALYDDAADLIQAAVDGQGVGLARSVLVLDELVSGRLIRLFDENIPGHFAYYIVYPSRHAGAEKIKALQAWLLQEAEESRRVLKKLVHASIGEPRA